MLGRHKQPGCPGRRKSSWPKGESGNAPRELQVVSGAGAIKKESWHSILSHVQGAEASEQLHHLLRDVS